MEIRRYTMADEARLFDMLREEGDGWACYFAEGAVDRYRDALAGSVTYVARDGIILCGYARCREDDGFGIYIYDLLVCGAYRGHGIGKALMDRVCTDFSGETVYVMSDVDAYYEKQSCRRVGSIFAVRASGAG